jgi:hypothetical protein
MGSGGLAVDAMATVNANQWPNIVWDFECFDDGLNATSHGGNHRISFNWGVREIYDEDALSRLRVTRLRVITVEYSGSFELEAIPQ